MRSPQPHFFRGPRNRAQVLSALATLALVGSGGCERQAQEPQADTSLSHERVRLAKAPDDLRIPDEYIVVFSEGVTGMAIDAAANQIARAGGANSLMHPYSVIPGFAARLDKAELDRLMRNPGVASIHENQQVSLTGLVPSPADGIDRADQRQGHDGTYNDHGSTGAGVHVYVLDTGLNAEHSEFSGRVGEGFTSVVDGLGTDDCNGHGTHVSSTIAGTLYGMAKEATVHPVRVLRCTGKGSWAGIIAGLNFVGTHCPLQDGPCVVNMSLAGETFVPVNTAVANLVNQGITVVVAAGNDNVDACTRSPSSEPKAITVAAVDDADTRAGFSNWGQCVDLFAPGVSILGASIGDAVATHVDDGTSMASPHVAGAVAQYLSTHRSATPTQINTNLKASATLDCVLHPQNSPNVLLFSDLNQGNFVCAAPGSCVGLCGEAADGCFCDPGCAEFGDCCPDYAQVCE
ncbi:S8 family serine peptidase [Myxococcus llanfairpwllgwyngyllgogerychwyrndrobwllllantysiliogogogochensis]|uniref:S8 family serine peptidase n=1 Tax=Myxococcus llanfairpwllgwyngyllgogerychwyrndrobwllllantysiliogogogochensis TaxID=2590453 RepID=A0A540WY60_9BACT|nr:S8 family serine peptidase [Myxococcus llanfairpwllgwyngyllgogerychwyrndrobwllllantysiliogogogochensis]TQF13364.1 S8 family serine peptidase [Myxococcus llanfairpwllgwyngyllgogerychwyrndrobwllllantysiliogogogochensis]